MTPADAYALGFLPAVSLLAIACETQLDSLGAQDPQTELGAALRFARGTLAIAARSADAARARLQELASRLGLALPEGPSSTGPAPLGQAAPLPFHAWQKTVRDTARAATPMSLQDVLSTGEAAGDLQLAVLLARALIHLRIASPTQALLTQQAKELEQARNDAAQRLLQTLASPHNPKGVAAFIEPLSARLAVAPHLLAATSPSDFRAYFDWMNELLSLLEDLTPSAARIR